MTEREFYDIVEGYEHVRFTTTPIFTHIYLRRNKLESKACETKFVKFKYRDQFIDFLEEEYRKGNTVYFYGGPAPTMYDPFDFSPISGFRLTSVDGISERKLDDDDKPKQINNETNYKYLVIR